MVLIIRMIHLPLHLLSLQQIILIHPLPNPIQTFILLPVQLQLHSSLRFLLLGKQPILFLFKLLLEFFFLALFLLFQENRLTLLFIHAFPVIRQHTVPTQHRLARRLNINPKYTGFSV